MKNIVGILLAAGSSRRFGSNKLFHPLPDGTPLGIASAQHLLEALPNCIAVVRKDDLELSKDFKELGIRVVENAQADEGMSTSVVAGIEASLNADGWIIALADMPWIKPETIKLLVNGLRGKASIVVPVYEGHHGNPVGFTSKWKDALCTLSGDRGARDLINSHTSKVARFSVNDDGVLRDVDVPGDV